MSRVNLNKLFYFFVVAKEGSVKAASQLLNLTQPTISGQLRELEEDLGFELFKRKHRKLEITPGGTSVLKKAERLFAIADEIEGIKPKAAGKHRAKVKIGAIQSLSNSFIFDFSLKLWSDETFEVSITQGVLNDLVSKLDRGKIDVLLTDSPLPISKKYQATRLGSDKVVVVSAPNFKLPKKPFPQNLEQANWLAFSNYGRLQNDIEYFLQRNSVASKKIGEVDDVTLMRVICESGNCFAVLPHRAVKESVKAKRLKIIGEIKEIEFGIWAVTPRLAASRQVIKKLLKDYFVRKGQ